MKATFAGSKTADGCRILPDRRLTSSGAVAFCFGGRVGARLGGIGVRELIMAKGYRRVDRDQPLLLAPDMREWIRDDPVWLVIEIIEQHLASLFR
jgi:hypothetical protein